MIDDKLRQSVLSDHAADENALGAQVDEGLIAGSRASRRRLPLNASPRKIAATRSTYTAYIKSDAWRLSHARLAELLASGGRCRLCNEGGPDSRLHVHHRTYERLGCELAEDLTALCEPCHDAITVLLRARVVRRHPLPTYLDLPKQNVRSLTDSLEDDR